MHLWNKKPLKVYGGRMSESILAILCHIIKGEAVIKVRWVRFGSVCLFLLFTFYTVKVRVIFVTFSLRTFNDVLICKREMDVSTQITKY